MRNKILEGIWAGGGGGYPSINRLSLTPKFSLILLTLNLLPLVTL